MAVRIGSGGVRAAVAIACCGFALAACESSRFGSRSPGNTRVPRDVADPVAPSVPSGTVVTEALPPPPGTAPSPIAPPPVARPPEPLPPAAPVAVTRSTAIGSWTAREASGTSCRVSLSSTPTLDLYRASASGCANRELARVTAWDFRDGEVFLYQPGGAVAARLRPAGGDLSGVLSRSGAPLSLTRA